MDKARKAAATALAAVEANAKVSTQLAETCASRLRMLMRRNREEVTASIGAALAAGTPPCRPTRPCCGFVALIVRERRPSTDEPAGTTRTASDRAISTQRPESAHKVTDMKFTGELLLVSVAMLVAIGVRKLNRF